MTIMPDVAAKTRIFKKFDSYLNGLNDGDLNALDQKLDDSHKIGDWMTANQSDIGLLKADHNHILKHIFGRSGPQHQWWDAEAEDICTEGLAWAIHLSFHDIHDMARDKRVPLETWWLCPATNCFRMILLAGVNQVTALIITPPKADHPAHYAEYKARPRLEPERFSGIPTPYDQVEDIVVVTAHRDAVYRGNVPVGKIRDSRAQIQGVTAVTPLAQRY
jgi:hypothetical protein